jgi:hypothetical protein
MATRLTKSEIQLLKELKAAGEHGRRIAGTSSAEIAHLIGAHYITERGRQVLAQVTAGKDDPD